MAEKGIRLDYDESLLKYLTEKSYSAVYGARNLRREIQREVEDKIANLIIDRYENPAKAISLSADENGVQLVAFDCFAKECLK